MKKNILQLKSTTLYLDLHRSNFSPAFGRPSSRPAPSQACAGALHSCWCTTGGSCELRRWTVVRGTWWNRGFLTKNPTKAMFHPRWWGYIANIVAEWSWMVCISRLQISSPSRARRIATMVLENVWHSSTGVFLALRFAVEVEGSTIKRWFQSTNLLIRQGKKMNLGGNLTHIRVLNQHNWDSGLFSIKQQKFRFSKQLLLRSWTDRSKVVRKNTFYASFPSKHVVSTSNIPRNTSGAKPV